MIKINITVNTKENINKNISATGQLTLPIPKSELDELPSRMGVADLRDIVIVDYDYFGVYLKESDSIVRLNGFLDGLNRLCEDDAMLVENLIDGCRDCTLIDAGLYFCNYGSYFMYKGIRNDEELGEYIYENLVREDLKNIWVDESLNKAELGWIYMFDHDGCYTKDGAIFRRLSHTWNSSLCVSNGYDADESDSD